VGVQYAILNAEQCNTDLPDKRQERLQQPSERQHQKVQDAIRQQEEVSRLHDL
jgi:hypothetical protein